MRPSPTTPSLATVDIAVSRALERGRARPTVTGVARDLGMPPSTFWRRYPDQARRIVAHAKARTTTQRPADREARLAAENRELQAQLDLAAATIMRLTLENSHLMQLASELPTHGVIRAVARDATAAE